MKFKRLEQETVITIDEYSGECTFYTCVPSKIKSYMRNPLLNKEEIEVLTSHEGKPTSIRFTVGKSFVTNSFIKKKKTLSEDHKKALKEGRYRKRIS
jgi:hypothetical protein